MRKIAILSDGWRKYFNFSWVDGCHQYIMEHELDAQVYVFNSFGSFSVDEKFNAGEYNIYQLPNLKEYDGIIVALNNMGDDTVRESILWKVRNSKVPAVALVNEIPGLHYVGIDNFSSMYEVVNHLITVHGCRKINFVGGPHNHYENKERLRAYMQALADHNIVYDTSRVYSGDFAITTGEDGFYYFEEKGPMPDAFVCANDNIAVGLCHVAKQKGYRIPDDFLVTGFDNLDKASYFDPKITTVSQGRGDISYKGMELIHRIWQGETVSEPVYIETTNIYQDSCGCKSQTEVNLGKYVEDHIWNEDRDVRMDRAMMELKRELLECQSFWEMGERLPAHLKRLQCDAIYMCMNREIAYCQDYASVGIGECGEIKDESFRVIGYPEEMEVVMSYVYEEKTGQKQEETPTYKSLKGQLLPEGCKSQAGDMFVISPIHFREREVGYLVFQNCDYMLDAQLIFEIMNVLLESMENMYHRIMLGHLNEELSQLYVLDSLTGLYNRMAYNRYAVPMFRECMSRGESLIIMFVDVDRLKYINDNYGHDSGNVAIKTIAMATMAQIPEDGIVIRYGGDEFVCLIPGGNQDKAEDIIRRISAHVHNMAHAISSEFAITASIGYTIASDFTRSLSDYIDEADNQMYQVKRAHHEEQEKKEE